MIHSINIMKDINHMIISVDPEKSLEKNETSIYEEKLSTKWVQREHNST